MSILAKEQWKWVKYHGIDYTRLYMVSNLGRAIKIENEKSRSICNTTIGRKAISLHKNNKTKSAPLARVIYFVFNDGDSKTKLVVDHKNNIPSDNRICNLQLITQSKNVSKDKNRQNIKRKDDGTWKASIGILKNNLYGNNTIYLGSYRYEHEAQEAYEVAKYVVSLYNIKNNDRIAQAIRDRIDLHRRVNKFKAIRRFSSHVSTKSRFYPYHSRKT